MGGSVTGGSTIISFLVALGKFQLYELEIKVAGQINEKFIHTDSRVSITVIRSTSIKYLTQHMHSCPKQIVCYWLQNWLRI